MWRPDTDRIAALSLRGIENCFKIMRLSNSEVGQPFWDLLAVFLFPFAGRHTGVAAEYSGKVVSVFVTQLEGNLSDEELPFTDQLAGTVYFYLVDIADKALSVLLLE